MVRVCVAWVMLSVATACTTTDVTLYDAIGGEKTIEQIVDNFIREIEYDPVIIHYFRGSNIKRFRQKLIEQLCTVTGGPCQYTGDTMRQVHTGMNINEKDFNRTVDLLIAAMDDAGVKHHQQNRILAVLAPMRADMLNL